MSEPSNNERLPAVNPDGRELAPEPHVLREQARETARLEQLANRLEADAESSGRRALERLVEDLANER